MKTPAPNKKVSPRRHSRELALQALYQWMLTQQSTQEVLGHFTREFMVDPIDIPYFRQLVAGVIEQQETLDQHLEPLLDRPIETLNPVEWAILRLSAYEFAQSLEVPYRVVINEGVELAKRFGAAESHRYVNAVLDKLAVKLRAVEIAARNAWG